MSDIIPPLISDTPPPPPCLDDEEDDEFGNFIGSNDLSYGCESEYKEFYITARTITNNFSDFSLPTTPVHSPKKVSIPNELDINSNTEKSLPDGDDQKLDVSKDHYDRRKSDSDEFSNFNTSSSSGLEDATLQDLSIIESFPNECKVNTKNEINPSSKIDTEISVNSSEGISQETTTQTGKYKENINYDDIKKESKQMFNKLLYISETLNDTINEPLETTLNYFEDHIEASQQEVIKSCAQLFDEINNDSEDTQCNEINIKNKLDIVNHIEYSSELCHTVDPPFVETVENKNKETIRISNKFEDCIEAEKEWLEESINKEDFEKFPTLNNHTECHKNEDGQTPSIGIKETPSISHDVPQVLDDNDLVLKEKFSDDNFADFTGFQVVNQNFPSENKNSFLSTPFIPIPDETTSDIIKDIPECDDFGEFVSTAVETREVNPLKQHDNFDDLHNTLVKQLSLRSNHLEKAQQLFEETFPKIENENQDYVYELLEKDNFIFDLLKDITDTPGLTYQWPKSSSQKLLLKALNIDERNIVSNNFYL